jgi:sugar fermentation stimulation protein A
VAWRHPPLETGRLVRRYQRFLAEVELASGRVVTAHCPNSGSMLDLLRPGAPVRLSRARPGRRTAYTWELVRAGRVWVGINTLVPNRLALAAARARALPLFAGVEQARAEVRVSQRSRVDLAAAGSWGRLYVEVKSVTLVREGVALFPDAVTARGRRHLQELARLVGAGHRAAMLYVVQRADAAAFAPAAEIDPAYAEAYASARAAGVEVAAVGAVVSPAQVRLARILPAAGD